MQANHNSATTSQMKRSKPTAPKRRQIHHKSARKEAPAAAQDLAYRQSDAVANVEAPARRAAVKIARQTKTAARKTMTSAVNEFASQAPEMARRGRNQAGAMIQDLTERGAEYLSQSARSNQMATVLIGGAIGCAVGYLVSQYESNSTTNGHAMRQKKARVPGKQSRKAKSAASNARAG